MSAPSDQRNPADGSSPFEPRSARTIPLHDHLERSTVTSRAREARAGRLPHVDDYPFADEAPVQRLRSSRSLEPDSALAAPPPLLRQPSGFGLFVRLLVVVIVAAAAAFLVVAQFPAGKSGSTTGTQVAAVGANPPVGSAARPSDAPAPRLVVESVRGVAGEPAPIGARIQGSTEGVAVFVSGLVSGTTLSMGRPVGTNGWWLPASDLPSTWVLPPQGFAGAMEVIVELRLADDAIADRKPVRLEWQPPVQVPVTEVRTAPQGAAAPASRPTAPTMAREDIEVLMQTGENLLSAGDIAGARVLLQRAAEARNARAALMLAATYDPVVLEQLGVYGIAPDVALARTWYEKAKEFGSQEAPRRLELLASQAGR